MVFDGGVILRKPPKERTGPSNVKRLFVLTAVNFLLQSGLLVTGHILRGKRRWRCWYAIGVLNPLMVLGVVMCRWPALGILLALVSPALGSFLWPGVVEIVLRQFVD